MRKSLRLTQFANVTSQIGNVIEIKFAVGYPIDSRLSPFSRFSTCTFLKHGTLLRSIYNCSMSRLLFLHRNSWVWDSPIAIPNCDQLPLENVQNRATPRGFSLRFPIISRDVSIRTLSRTKSHAGQQKNSAAFNTTVIRGKI